MAVALRSSMDLMYLPDHGFLGEPGAFRILPQLTRTIRRIDISHNLLGTAGVLTLFKGITTMRTRYSSPEIGLGVWGLTEVNLGFNDLGDSALEGVLAYAKKDWFLKRLLVQGNSISLKENVQAIINSLNASHIALLSLTNNNTIDDEALATFFDLLDAPHLRQLHLSTCELSPAASACIARFLKTDRARNLESLELNGNRLGADGVTEIVDAVEQNYSILALGLLANEESSPSSSALSTIESEEEEREVRYVDREAERKIMEYQVHHRLPLLLERNRTLTKRVRLAASRIIAPARIILNGSQPTDQDTAQRVIDQVSNLSNSDSAFFRLLDLPQEIIYQIVRHTSQDYNALSEQQFVRIRAEATDRKTLQRMIDLRKERMKGKWNANDDDERDVLRGLRDDWLTRGSWDRWQIV